LISLVNPHKQHFSGIVIYVPGQRAVAKSKMKLKIRKKMNFVFTCSIRYMFALRAPLTPLKFANGYYYNIEAGQQEREKDQCKTNQRP
jgi:hypothetical protein